MKILLLFFSLFLCVFSVSAQKLEDASKKTLGYISANGTIENASRSMLGYVNANGAVENASRKTLGYAKGVKREYAAAYFFFFF